MQRPHVKRAPSSPAASPRQSSPAATSETDGAAPGAKEGVARAGAAGPRPGDRSPEAEVRRLRTAAQRREITLERLLEATLTVRRANTALQAENRELRLELERLRRGRRG